MRVRGLAPPLLHETEFRRFWLGQTISVFGDTANAGTLLGENPVRANYTGQPVFGPGTRTAERWFNPAAFSTPAAFAYGNVGRNTVYGPGMQTLDVALHREFALTERLRFQVRGELFNDTRPFVFINIGNDQFRSRFMQQLREVVANVPAALKRHRYS